MTTETFLKAITANTYSRSDLAYRIGVVKEFLEYVYFTVHDTHATTAAIEPFAKDTRKPAADIAFLRTLPDEVLGAFEQNSFYDVLTDITNLSKRLPELSLTLPIVLPRDDVEAIGEWARRMINPDIVLEISVDSTLSAGCQIVWKDRLYNYTLERYLRAHREELTNKVARAMVH